MLQPVDALVAARSALAAVQVAQQGLGENVVDQRALAGAGDASHANERAQGNRDIDFLEIVVRGADDGEPGRSRLPGGTNVFAAVSAAGWHTAPLIALVAWACRVRGRTGPARQAGPTDGSS